MSTRNDIQASAPTPERIDAIRQWLSHRPEGRSPEVVFAVNVALDLLAEVDRLAEDYTRAEMWRHNISLEAKRLRAALEELAHNHDSYSEVGRIVRNALENRDD